MRILGVTETCDLGSMYLRLLREGHEVQISISNPLAAGTMAEMVPRTADWQSALPWIREAGREGLILFEAVGFGALQDRLRQDGFNVIGGSAFGDRLENDRAFAQQLLAGIGMEVAATTQFASAKDALKDLEERPRRCVFKRASSAGDTWVGAFADGRDIASLLRVRPPTGPFVLMDYLSGIETAVGAYFNGTNFLRPACLDWEHKRFFPGDLGELTGEMGTVATFAGSEALFEATLGRTERVLREHRHVGWVNLNMIINEQGLWPLEFTCRFGYPGFAVLEPLQAIGWGELFAAMLAGRRTFPARHGYSVGVVLSTPPFPLSREEVDLPVGLPVLVGEVEEDQLHLGEVGRQNGELVTTGLYGWTAVVTGVGASVEEARLAAYRRAGAVVAPNLRYRRDIGERLMSGELDALRALGWVREEQGRS